MVKRIYMKGLVVGIIILFIGIGVQPAFAVEPKLSTNNIQFGEDIEPKDYLFETIIDIANNPEVKELFEENKRNIFDLIYGDNDIDKQILLNNPSLFLTLLFSKPKMTSEYLNFAYNKGSVILNIIGNDEALEMIEAIENSDSEILKDLNNIIVNNKETSKRIAILSELNYNEIICTIAEFLYLTSLVVFEIFRGIWDLNPDGIIWSIIFLPPTYISIGLIIISLYLLFEFECINLP